MMYRKNDCVINIAIIAFCIHFVMVPQIYAQHVPDEMPATIFSCSKHPKKEALILMEKGVTSWNKFVFEGRKKHDLDNAIDQLLSSIKLEPSLIHAYTQLGVIFCSVKGNCRKGISYLNEGIMHCPDESSLYFSRALLFNKNKQYKNAIDDFSTAKKLGFLVNSTFYFNLGLSYSRLEKHKKAINNYENSISYNTNNLKARKNLVISYWKINNLDKAVTNAKIIRELDLNGKYGKWAKVALTKMLANKPEELASILQNKINQKHKADELSLARLLTKSKANYSLITKKFLSLPDDGVKHTIEFTLDIMCFSGSNNRLSKQDSFKNKKLAKPGEIPDILTAITNNIRKNRMEVTLFKPLGEKIYTDGYKAIPLKMKIEGSKLNLVNFFNYAENMYFLSDVSFDLTHPRKGIKKRNTPLEKLDISQLKLIAILNNRKQALVEDSSGKGYLIKPGVLIGPNSGRVTAIFHDRIIIEETTHSDISSNKKMTQLKLSK